eukprot:scaffold797_cov191-Alexandrium_tamarense.AAC.1
MRESCEAVGSALPAKSRYTSGLSHTCGRAPSDPKELYIQEGDEIVITESEHHSNIIPWQMVVQRTGAVLKFVPACSITGGFDMNAFKELIGPNTKFVSVQHVSNVLGSINPIESIVEVVRSQAAPKVKITARY